MESPLLPENNLRGFHGDLPAPDDDGACRHLTGLPLPFMSLASTSGSSVNLACERKWAVVYCYPMTGRPGKLTPQEWAALPGAAGCNSQSCAYRDSFAQFNELGVSVYGVSAQTTQEQKADVRRLGLPHELLSDPHLSFAQAINLPTFEAGGRRMIKRLTLIVRNGTIEKCFYPVFPPERNALEVVAWLRASIG